MINISNNGIITINRGDTFTKDFVVNIGTKMEPIKYQLQKNDKLFLAVTEPNQQFENAIIKKVYTQENLTEDGNVQIKFNSEDTENLLSGVYYYTIKLFKHHETDDEIDTLISKRKFIILD